MSVKHDNSMKQGDYDKMVDTMMELYNRGGKTAPIVKRIAKAGNVTQLMKYADTTSKLLKRFMQDRQAAETENGTGNSAPRRKAKKRTRRAASSEAASE